MFSKLKIGDFAQLNNVSIQTLRYYEKVGLIAPMWIDPTTKYRYYDINQSAVIDNIQFLKQFQFSLEEIKYMMDETETLTELNETIEEKKLALSAQLEQIHQQLQDIASFQEGALIYQEKKTTNTLEFIEFPRRSILSYTIDRNIYEMSDVEYEYYLRDFKEHLVHLGLPIGRFNRVGTQMQLADFLKSQFVSKNLFVFVPHLSKKTTVLPKGLYAVYYCHSFKEELPRLQEFKNRLAETDYYPIGNYICEVVYEKNKTDAKKRSMFIRMQIPVKKNPMTV